LIANQSHILITLTKEVRKFNKRIKSMKVGERGERVEEKRKRHIKEAEDDINGWERELQFAIEYKDAKYEKYCKFMISVWKKTLVSLEKYKKFENVSGL
jgi:hypothetical protein